MHPRTLATRESVAAQRTVAAAKTLAERFGLDDRAKALTIEDKHPDIQQLFRNEAVADFLEALTAVELPSAEDIPVEEIVATTEELLLARIEALDGIGPKTMELIRKGLAESSIDVLVEIEEDAETPSDNSDKGNGNSE
jgi:hypothetical protein